MNIRTAIGRITPKKCYYVIETDKTYIEYTERVKNKDIDKIKEIKGRIFNKIKPTEYNIVEAILKR